MTSALEDARALIGVRQYEETADFPVERGYVWNTCAAVENANPLFWDDDVAASVTGGPIAPPTTLSLWMRPHYWSPGHVGERLALQVHFDMKERLSLPEAIISENTITFYEPVRPGDLISYAQVLRSVSDEKTTKLGTGRFWVIDVEYTNQDGELVGVESYTSFGYRRGAVILATVTPGQELPPLAYDVTATTVVLGALASRDWRPMHHDHDFAVNRNGTKDIFLNTPNQAAWFERYLTDWSGPLGRLGRMTFRIRGSVFPGDTMLLTGTVTAVETDDTGCGWVDVDVTLAVDGDAKTTCAARIAVPTSDDDNPWSRRGDRWRP